jgi:hypothetical protein
LQFLSSNSSVELDWQSIASATTAMSAALPINVRKKQNSYYFPGAALAEKVFDLNFGKKTWDVGRFNITALLSS